MKRTFGRAVAMSVYDPKRTFHPLKQSAFFDDMP
jgi:hypothetical protein